MAGLKKMFNSQLSKLAKYVMLSLWIKNTQIAEQLHNIEI